MNRYTSMKYIVRGKLRSHRYAFACMCMKCSSMQREEQKTVRRRAVRPMEFLTSILMKVVGEGIKY